MESSTSLAPRLASIASTWHDDFGNGVLSALPIRSWQRIPLGLHGAKHYRNILQLKFTVDARVLNVLVTHLESTDASARQMQWQTIAALFKSLPSPVVLIGDLNMPPDDSSIKTFLDAGDAVDALANLPVEHPETRIDWILVRGLKCFDRGSTEAGASDHPCYWVDCEIAE
jgi:endonuclease/exonuclease/phosphatase family metal-dependent hydrolase